LPGVLHHHERYDGKGYPSGLAGEQIPVQARIIQIADVFDALTSTRSYRAAFSWKKALDIMHEEAGKTIDPQLQQLFDGMMRVRLEGNERAWDELVVQANKFIGDAAAEGAVDGEA
jgi:HD-GYP domain-containing protein (c-di-GMP phosphodiesterase class II)